MPPVDRKHQRIIITLLTAIGHYAGGHGGEVLTAPFQMRLQELRRGRQPDLIYVGSEQLGQLTTNFLDGPASLVVEVVSAETKVTDTCEKFSEYQIAGVKEYWIIDPDDRKCSFYVLNAAGMYIEQQISANEKYASVVLPGLTIDTRWFWRLRPPGPVEIMNAIALSESEGE
jgi:Uma2 family endonuclease